MPRRSSTGVGLGLPEALTRGPELGGIVNLPAIFIIAVVAGLLMLGTRESATLNAILVVVKIVALARVRRGRAAAISTRPTSTRSCPTAFAKRRRAGRRRARRDGGGGDHLLRLLRLRRDLDRGGGGQEPRPRPRDRHRRIDGRLHRRSTWSVAAAAVGALAYTRFANSPEPLALILRELGQPRVGDVRRAPPR